MDAEFLDDAKDVGGRDIVERVLVFLLEAPAQIFGGNVTGFPIAQIAGGTLAKCDEAGVRETKDHSFSVDDEFAIHGVAMARGDGVPTMRKMAVVNEIGNFRRHVEGADKFAHRARVGDGRIRRSFGHESGYFPPATTAGWADC